MPPAPMGRRSSIVRDPSEGLGHGGMRPTASQLRPRWRAEYTVGCHGAHSINGRRRHIERGGETREQLGLTLRLSSSLLPRMRRGAIARSILFLLLTITATGCSSPGGDASTSSGRAPARRRIAVIPKGTTHEFWKAVHAGAVKAARELDVDVIWKGPVKEDDRDEQIKVIETFLAQRRRRHRARAARRPRAGPGGA